MSVWNGIKAALDLLEPLLETIKGSFRGAASSEPHLACTELQWPWLQWPWLGALAGCSRRCCGSSAVSSSL